MSHEADTERAPLGPRNPDGSACGWGALLFFLPLLLAAPWTWRAAPDAGDGPPPDLRLEWMEGGRATTDGSDVVGVAGQRVSLAYQVRNVGGSDAYAVVISAYTALGRLGQRLRLQPGPAVGRALRRQLEMTLARGMRQLCLEVRLQTLEADEAQDPNPDDNRLCRRLEVSAPALAFTSAAQRKAIPSTRQIPEVSL